MSQQQFFTHKGSFYLAGHGDKEVGLLDVGFGYSLSVNQDLACVSAVSSTLFTKRKYADR